MIVSTPPNQEQADSLKGQLGQQQAAVDNLLNNTRCVSESGGESSGPQVISHADGGLSVIFYSF